MGCKYKCVLFLMILVLMIVIFHVNTVSSASLKYSGPKSSPVLLNIAEKFQFPLFLINKVESFIFLKKGGSFHNPTVIESESDLTGPEDSSNDLGLDSFTLSTDAEALSSNEPVVISDFAGSSSEGDLCTDTCSSLNYECDIHEVCGESVDCGSCSSYETCSQGACVLETETEYLYNWYAANDSRNIANTGWHVSTSEDFNVLVTYMGNGDKFDGMDKAGNLKETGTLYWNRPNIEATNLYGFNAKATGFRDSTSFSSIYDKFYLWTPHQFPSGSTNGVFLPMYSNFIWFNNGGTNGLSKYYGASIRLVKDSSTCFDGETGIYTGNDGKTYSTICIGTQEWLAENLAETKYRNGDVIPEVTDNVEWASLTTGALCSYELSPKIDLIPSAIEATNVKKASLIANWWQVLNADGYYLDVSRDKDFTEIIIENLDVGNVLSYEVSGLEGGEYYYRIRFYNDSYVSSNSNVIGTSLFTGGYGLLYNWYAVSDSRNIANIDWHVPTKEDWGAFYFYLGNDGELVGEAIKTVGAIYWRTPNLGTNEAEFSSKGAGFRYYDGKFDGLKGNALWWSSTPYNADYSWFGMIIYDRFSIMRDYAYYKNRVGQSIRLVKDSSTCFDGETGIYTGNDGKTYSTICIGTQEWLAENLAETKYRNGDVIPEVTDNVEWASLTTGALCAYNNDWYNVDYGEGYCIDTCSSLNYECGIQEICGVNIMCGTCLSGYNCETNGTCIKNPPVFVWTGELTINGGFEFGNLTGWTTLGSWTVGYDSEDNGEAGPQAESYCAYNDIDANINNYIYQDVDLTEYADSIDAGDALINVSGWGVSTNYNINFIWDLTRIQFIFLNSAKEAISIPIDTGYVNNPNWWQASLSEYSIPVNTRYIRVLGNSYESGYTMSGSLDSFSVKIKAEECSDTCSSLGYTCGSACGIDCGTCSLGYYCNIGICTECTSHSTSACYSGDVYWYNSCGDLEDLRYDCNETQTCSSGQCLNVQPGSQIIADHTVVEKYDDIPQCYIDEIKTMLVNMGGESHSMGYQNGANLLELYDSRFQVQTYTSTPPAETDQSLRLGRPHMYGEDIWTSQTGIDNLIDDIDSQNDTGNPFDVFAFGWCWDMTWENLPGGTEDSVFNVRWAGSTEGGPDGSMRWGLDSGDEILTGNSVSMDNYLDAIEQYNEYFSANNIPTVAIFTTGPVDSYTDENAYQRELKHDYIRQYVLEDQSRILFDYADILVYNDNGEKYTEDWDDNGELRAYSQIHPDNLLNYDPEWNMVYGEDYDEDHIGQVGALRIAKAEWWMLARIAGWDGVSTTCS